MPQLGWSLWQGADSTRTVLLRNVPGPGVTRPELGSAAKSQSLDEDETVELRQATRCSTRSVPLLPLNERKKLTLNWEEVRPPSKLTKKGNIFQYCNAPMRKTRSFGDLSSHMANWAAGMNQTLSRYRGNTSHAASRAPSLAQEDAHKNIKGDFETMGDWVRSHRESGWGLSPADGAATQLMRLNAARADSKKLLDRVAPSPLLLGEVSDDFEIPSIELPEWDNEDAAKELHIAASLNDCQRVRLLLTAPDTQHRVPADVLNAEGDTALLCAARDGRAAVCVPLLDGHADPLVRDTCPRHFADGVWPDELQPDEFGAKPTAEGPLSSMFRTAVYHMRLRGIFDEVLSGVAPETRVSLVRAIADSIQEFHGMPALFVAAQQDKPNLAGVLLANCAAIPGLPLSSSTPLPSIVGDSRPPSLYSPKSRPLSPASCSLTPHASLSPKARSEILRPFSPTRSEVSMLSSRTNFSVFSSEASSRWEPTHVERADALLEALANGHWRVAEVFLAAGVCRSHLDFIRYKHGRTPLHMAAKAGQERLVKALLAAGASPRIYSKQGYHPLHEACLVGHAEVVRVLLDGGANPAAPVQDCRGARKGDIGKSPLGLANSRGHKHLSVYFLDTEVLDEASPSHASVVGDSARSKERPRAWSDHAPSAGMRLLPKVTSCHFQKHFTNTQFSR